MTDKLRRLWRRLMGRCACGHRYEYLRYPGCEPLWGESYGKVPHDCKGRSHD